MSFIPVKHDDGKTVTLQLAASQTIVKGDGLVFSSGYLAAAADGTEKVEYVALEDITSGAGENPDIKVIRASGSDVKFEADTAANTAVTNRGTIIECASKSTLDTATTSGTDFGFYVEDTVGAAANKKVVGYFL